jgi:ubiquinol-cytochrome c reductase cytochrome b subunit
MSSAGQFIRGVHHFTAHALIIVLAVHVLRVVLTAAFRAPRELIWLTGLVLLPLVVAWVVTGNPLSAGQKGMAQIEVEGNIIASTPVIGPALRQFLIGGDEVGNLTLTHLYFLHVGLLPLLAFVFLAIHLSQVRRHGLAAEGGQPSEKARPYWPFQSARNAVVVAAALAAVAILAAARGAPLDAPADHDLAHMPRPEWYFRSLFELRRHLTGDWEFLATLVVPLSALAFFLLLPFLDRRLPRRLGLVMRIAVVVAATGGWAWLTWLSLDRDWRDPEYQAAQADAARFARRARELADTQPIGVEGAVALLRRDPQTRGPILFGRHCAGCHSHADQKGQGLVSASPSAPNLFGIGSRDWIANLLDPDEFAGSRYFADTKFADGDMAAHLSQLLESDSDEESGGVRSQLRLAALALAAEAGLEDDSLADEVEEGRMLLQGDLACTDCHRFHDQGELGTAPDLTGYASRAWLVEMIRDPQGERFYPGDLNDRMPAFYKDAAPNAHNLLSGEEIELVVDWLRGAGR